MLEVIVDLFAGGLMEATVGGLAAAASGSKGQVQRPQSLHIAIPAGPMPPSVPHPVSWGFTIVIGSLALWFLSLVGSSHVISGAIGTLVAIPFATAFIATCVALPASLLLYLALSWVLNDKKATDQSWKGYSVLEAVRPALLLVSPLMVLAVALFSPITWPVLLIAAVGLPLLVALIQVIRLQCFPSSLLTSGARMRVRAAAKEAHASTRTLARGLLKVQMVLKRGAPLQSADLLNGFDPSLHGDVLYRAVVHGHSAVVKAIVNGKGYALVEPARRLEAVACAICYGDDVEIVKSILGQDPDELLEGRVGSYDLFYYAIHGRLYFESRLKAASKSSDDAASFAVLDVLLDSLRAYHRKNLNSYGESEEEKYFQQAVNKKVANHLSQYLPALVGSRDIPVVEWLVGHGAVPSESLHQALISGRIRYPDEVGRRIKDMLITAYNKSNPNGHAAEVPGLSRSGRATTSATAGPGIGSGADYSVSPSNGMAF